MRVTGGDIGNAGAIGERPQNAANMPEQHLP
eukprot:CAMPEP_0176094580 /NCGR_PEP_ID=MMETSP0120_2-20121206/47394_1 /TAXON_ID=160619 /ORGANISM="Kryptoperidinium foliaceum, Strain CCMP 1326" /LENGTH=30 /DNA_ID= /DNA_START= /DNA_END= /DNA_ORIENTATION=